MRRVGARLVGASAWDLFVNMLLGSPVVRFYPFSGEGSPTKIDYREKGTLILTSLLEDLGLLSHQETVKNLLAGVGGGGH